MSRVDFPVPDPNTVPDGSRELLSNVEAKFGFTPNLTRILAQSPQALEGYLTLSQLFGNTSLEPVEREVVILAVSYANACDYCMAAHSTGARMGGVPDEIVDALREGRPLSDSKLETLRSFTESVVRNRGWPSDDDVRSFLEAGFTKPQVFEVLLGVTMKTLSNYTNHIADTPVDEPFSGERWEPSTTAHAGA